MEPVKVKILDHEYFVKAEEDEEQVHRIAQYVNERLKEIRENTEGLSEYRMAILAAMNIASEYFQVAKERDELLHAIKQRTRSLIYHIDSMIG